MKPFERDKSVTPAQANIQGRNELVNAFLATTGEILKYPGLRERERLNPVELVRNQM